MSRRAVWRWMAILGVATMLAAACGDSGSKTATPATGASGTGASGSGASGSTTTGTPQTGGVVTVGQFSAPAGLDPAKLAGGGTVGGMELQGIYDSIMRYNNVTGKYEPHTAESLTPNADYSVWTLKLKAGIKFTDGTDYNADAVKFVYDRELKEGNAAPKSQLAGSVKTLTVNDPLTLTYTLTQPWAGFPYVLSSVNGMIYSPTAYQKAGANFNTAPGDAGAGPFKLKSYKPGESIELERNPTYYGGTVYLDGLIFKNANGADPTYQAIKANTFQAGFVRDPATIAQAKADKFGTLDMPAPAGSMINMNSGIKVTCTGGNPAYLCAGKPDGTVVPTKTATADPRVRQAVAHAVDPKVVNERAYQGKAQPDSAPFANFPWDPHVPGPTYDPTLAKSLVQQAKASGWDGKIRLLADTSPTGTAWAQSIAPQLTAVGMDVSVDITGDISTVVNKVLVLKDFDLTTWAYGILDESDANYQQLLGTFSAPAGRYGYSSPDMIAAVDMLRTADTDAKRVAAYKAITDVWVRDMPAAIISNIPQALIFTPKLHGVVRQAGSTPLFDKAWLEK